jgi:hypothetical protein
MIIAAQSLISYGESISNHIHEPYANLEQSYYQGLLGE